MLVTHFVGLIVARFRLVVVLSSINKCIIIITLYKANEIDILAPKPHHLKCEVLPVMSSRNARTKSSSYAKNVIIIFPIKITNRSDERQQP